ncbi:MAG: SIS domain-containing protein [Candidatus Muiribacteriota bacterium]
MNNKSLFAKKIDSVVKCMEKLVDIEVIIEKVISEIVECLQNGKKVIVFGNGGSASDALHFAAELQGRFFLNRKGLAACCLNSNVSTITAVGNDFGFAEIFRKPLEGLLNSGDVVIGISTSGNSENVLNAMHYAEKNGGITVGLLGKDGGKIKEYCKYPLIAPSEITPEIQEMHILIIHYISEIVEKRIFE